MGVGVRGMRGVGWYEARDREGGWREYVCEGANCTSGMLLPNSGYLRARVVPCISISHLPDGTLAA